MKVKPVNLLVAVFLFAPVLWAAEIATEIDAAERFIREGAYDQAIQSYEKALDINPNHLEANLRLGLVYGSLGHYEEAIRYTRKAASINPGYLPFYNLGLIYGAKEDPLKALEAFDEALKHNPESYRAKYQKGLIYTSMKDYVHAAESYQRVIDLNPEFDDAYLSLGAVTLEQGDKAGALKQVERLRQLNKEMLATALDAWIREREA